MVIKISIKGEKEVAAYLASLPSKTQKVIFGDCSTFMKNMQQNMILMAPQSTGFLKSQINLNSDGKSNITIDIGDAYYAIFQDLGFRAHSIPLKYMSQHLLSPATSGIYTSGPFVNVSKNTPFITPAFEKAISQLNSMLSNALNKSI